MHVTSKLESKTELNCFSSTNQIFSQFSAHTFDFGPVCFSWKTESSKSDKKTSGEKQFNHRLYWSCCLFRSA